MTVVFTCILMNHLTGSIVYYQLVESLLDDADVAVWLFCKQLWHEVFVISRIIKVGFG